MSEKEEVVVHLENVAKTFHIRERKIDTIRDSIFNFYKRNELRAIEALKPINLSIRKGEIFGIIGRNGSGKSTLLKIMAGAFPPNKGGKVTIEGRLIRLALGMGFDGNLSARQNIYLNGSILGLSFKEIGKRFDSIIDFAELHDFIDTKIKFYSSGMISRLAFAIAVQADADIFLMDEFFGGVGDANFQEKSEKVFREAFLNGRTIIHVSHNLISVKEHCDRVLVLHKGAPVHLGDVAEGIELYLQLNQDN